MQLTPEIKVALENIQFIERYQNLSMKYNFDEEFLYDNHEVLRIFNELGYHARFDKRENFFQIAEEGSPYQFKFNISLKYSLLEFIWVVRKDGKLLTGSPWDILKRLLDGTDENVRAPVFRNYNDLKEILKEAFSMYEDFKRELLSVYRNEKRNA
ncbi:hypothetical protein JQC72_03770 [Polycladomyces sp. WAk]|uniref:Uncharacterized protein n=1 Tax=Polycladomyces zharkentensis TaxID=2807616 RepID=A0ABS2WGJ4_9BACL|nr:hypothetical protein [Polycladomyces sp. WAk]MBN2908636.1 hypothetical protein [Polycladomyces sp. WAk]